MKAQAAPGSTPLRELRAHPSHEIRELLDTTTFSVVCIRCGWTDYDDWTVAYLVTPCQVPRGETPDFYIKHKERDMPVWNEPTTELQSAETDVMRKKYRQLSHDAREQMEFVKTSGENLCNTMDSIGRSRELSLAKTKIEEAVMWAVKHITR